CGGTGTRRLGPPPATGPAIAVAGTSTAGGATHEHPIRLAPGASARRRRPRRVAAGLAELRAPPARPEPGGAPADDADDLPAAVPLHPRRVDRDPRRQLRRL